MVLLGPFDPLQLVFQTLNTLLKNNLITYDQAREILMNSLNPALSEKEKNEIIDSMLKRN